MLHGIKRNFAALNAEYNFLPLWLGCQKKKIKKKKKKEKVKRKASQESEAEGT